MRKVLYGIMYDIELAADGTGTVRRRLDNMPVAMLTSAATERIAAANKNLVDRLAEEAVKTPAPWSARELSRIREASHD